LALLAGALQFRGQSHDVAALIAAAEPEKKADESEKKTEKSEGEIKTIHHETEAMKEMLQSMLVANSQQMYALNNLQQETHKLRQGYEKHHERILACRRKLADLKATTLEALKDEQLADGVAYPSFIEVDSFGSVKSSLVETRERLEKLAAMLQSNPEKE